MIEVLSTSRCTECDICVHVCPTNVFDAVPAAAPTIARQDDCQTCFQCEAWCPADAIVVAPFRTPAPAESSWRDELALERDGHFGRYRAQVGWGRHPVLPDPEAGATVLALMATRAVGLLGPGLAAPAGDRPNPS